MSEARPLIHIGYHKTASTWLQREVFDDAAAGYCRPWRRPRVLQDWVRVDPLAFRVERTRRAYRRGILRAADRGLVPVLSHERLSGYPASGGYDAGAIAQRLFRVFPRARMLIVIREQCSLLRSWYLQYIRDGGSLSLQRYLEPPLRGLQRIPGFRYRFYEFDRLIRRYQELFSTEGVLVLPFELLCRRPNAFVAAISSFVSLDAPPPRHRPRRNASPSALWCWLLRYGNWWFNVNQLHLTAPLDSSKLYEGYCRWIGAVGRLTPEWVHRRFDRRLRERIAARIGDRYAESNARTAELTGLELSAHGYPCAMQHSCERFTRSVHRSGVPRERA